jgi:hypothetical protein
VAALLCDVSCWTGGRDQDGMAVLALKRVGAGS